MSTQVASSQKTPRVHTFNPLARVGIYTAWLRPSPHVAMWYCMWTSCESVPSYCRENAVVSQTVALSCPYNWTGLPSLVTRGFSQTTCLQEALCARPCKANSNCCREKHAAFITITHRISGRSARRNRNPASFLLPCLGGWRSTGKMWLNLLSHPEAWQLGIQ